MNAAKYKLQSNYSHISEGSAMSCCQKSYNILRLVDEFEVKGQTYLVTKYAQGGDLLNYLKN